MLIYLRRSRTTTRSADLSQRSRHDIPICSSTRNAGTRRRRTSWKTRYSFVASNAASGACSLLEFNALLRLY